MPVNPTDALRELLSSELHTTLGKLWNSEQDTAFLRYNAEKVAKYVVIFKDPGSSQAAKDEARFNLDMLQASVAAYAHQKAMTAEQSAGEIAKKVAELVVGILIRAVV